MKEFQSDILSIKGPEILFIEKVKSVEQFKFEFDTNKYSVGQCDYCCMRKLLT